MSEMGILHAIAMMMQTHPDFSRGCSAGFTDNSAAIRIRDKNGKSFIISVTAEQVKVTE